MAWPQCSMPGSDSTRACHALAVYRYRLTGPSGLVAYACLAHRGPVRAACEDTAALTGEPLLADRLAWTTVPAVPRPRRAAG